MVKITIENKKYTLPERLTVKQWRQLVNFDYANTEHWPKIIAVLLNEDVEILKRCTLDSLTLAIAFTVECMNRRKEFVVRDFNDILFGEFIDLDIYMVMGVEKHLEQIVEILSEGTEWADEAMWLVDQYSLFRVHTYRQYAVLFGINDKLEQDEDDELEKWDSKKIAKGWYRVITDLAQEDILKIDLITDQPLKKALNFMAYKKEKQLEENFRLMQQKRQNDLARR